jgi:hypothetical protein
MKYITHKTLGGIGNLASQIQQYAALFSIAKANNRKIVFPESSLDYGYGFKFNRILDVQIDILPDKFFEEFVDIDHNTSIAIDTKLFQLNENVNYNLTNRFDLYHYWYSTCKDDILGWDWNKDEYEAAFKIYNSLPIHNKETVAIHVRRGDYLLPQHDLFSKLDNDYYGRAVEFFTENIEKYWFLIFSNDIDWCKENLIDGEMVTFIEPGSDLTDLVLMSMCNHQIIANSSYSWWAAFKNKNPNKIVICPEDYIKNWHPYSQLINKNYYPPDWIGIKNFCIK